MSASSLHRESTDSLIHTNSYLNNYYALRIPMKFPSKVHTRTAVSVELLMTTFHRSTNNSLWGLSNHTRDV